MGQLSYVGTKFLDADEISGQKLDGFGRDLIVKGLFDVYSHSHVMMAMTPLNGQSGTGPCD